jgi:hypothetical protein
MVKTRCRDWGALALSAAAAERCGDCGSPRLVSHAAELGERKLAARYGRLGEGAGRFGRGSA